MVIQEWGKGYIEPFWNDEFKKLNYWQENFNNPTDLKRWRNEGYTHPDTYFTGHLCDMRSQQPSWNHQLVRWVKETFNIRDVGSSYYRMPTGTILPNHSDIYKKYLELFRCNAESVIRILVMPEDWKSGHYLEVAGVPFTNWKAGDYFWWRNDVVHMAANIGTEDRYTIQLTGHQV